MKLIFTTKITKFLSLLIGVLSLIALGAGLMLTGSQYRELFGPPLALSDQHHDFMAYYSAGVLAAQHHISQIYEAAPLIHIQRPLIDQPVGAAGYMPYLNPPPVALFMSIFAQLSEPAARIIWWTINAVLIGLCAWLATTPLRPTRRIIASLAIVLSLPVYQTLIEGQLSILILAGCLAAIALFRRHHPVLASICLSALWLKPQLAVMVLGVLILSRAWKIIAGYLATPTAIFLLLLPFTGLGVHLTYLSFLVGVLASHFNGAGRLTASVWQGSLGLTQGINGFFVSIFGQSNLTIVNALTLAATASLGIPFLWLIFRGIRPGLQNSRQILMLSATGAMILLVDPHLYLQDVVLLFAVLPLLCHKHQFKLIIATVSLTNIALLDSYTHIHLFTLVLFVATITTFIYLLHQKPQAKTQ